MTKLTAECIYRDGRITREMVDDPPPPFIEVDCLQVANLDGVMVFGGSRMVTLDKAEGITSLVYIEREAADGAN
jgi:hypothetical protein